MKKKLNPKNFWKQNYFESWNYIKESRNFIYFIVVLFVMFAFIGYFVSLPEELSLKLFEYIQNLLEQTEGLSAGELVSFIFFNNLQSSFSGMIFGFFLGILPILSAIINGYLVGYVSFLTIQTEGFFVLWRLFPHGIFELPAIFLSLGMGLKFGTFIFKKKKAESFRKYFFKSLKVFLFIVFPLLIVAALIEGLLIASGI